MKRHVFEVEVIRDGELYAHEMFAPERVPEDDIDAAWDSIFSFYLRSPKFIRNVHGELFGITYAGYRSGSDFALTEEEKAQNEEDWDSIINGAKVVE